MNRHVSVLCCLLLATSAQAAPHLALFADPEYTSCNLDIPAPPGFGTFYVVALDATQLTCPGLTGAEFRIAGLPPGWFAVSTASPQANLAIGDPCGTGANIAFPECHWVDSFRLYTITVFPAAPGAQAVLHVAAHATPSNPMFDCPLLVWCDCPVDPTLHCVTGGALFINSPLDCALPVAPATWTRVKALYR